MADKVSSVNDKLSIQLMIGKQMYPITTREIEEALGCETAGSGQEAADGGVQNKQ